MTDKPSSFTVSDRRKFTLDGDLRDGSTATEPTPATEAASPTAPPPAASTETGSLPASGPRLVTKPAAAPEKPQEKPQEEPVIVGENHALSENHAADDEELIPEPTAEESAAQHAAYRQSSLHLDAMLRQANPGMPASSAVTMEHVIQSIYLSAVVAMGAAAEPGQKPRIDILGARQSIDMLSVIEEKTRGNLNEKEQRLLQNALFEVRMMFLELTNAIAQQAQKPPQGIK